MDDQTVWAILLGLTATALGVALAFEHIGGLKPCPLCYQQRWPYYALIVLSAAALTALYLNNAAADAHAARINPQTASPEEFAQHIAAAPSGFGAFLFSRFGLIAAILILFVSAAMGLHHAGVEWKWWPGPDSCAGGGAVEAAGSLIERMQAARVVRCDEAAGRFLGLSFAGYNALFSLGLAAFLALHFYVGGGRADNYVAAERAPSETSVRKPDGAGAENRGR